MCDQEIITNKIKEQKFESDQLDQLYSALAKAQQEMETALTDSNNPFFKSKYADLTSIVKASRPYLTKNGLSVIQRVMTDDSGNMYLYTRLAHMSGQWIESKMPINPTKTDIQAIGSYITYLKRYNLSAIVGVATDDANDDDGENAMDRNKKMQAKVDNSSEVITEEKVKYLSDLVRKIPEDKQIDEINKLLSQFNINEIKELKNKDFVSFNNELNKKIKNVKGK